MEKKSEYIIKVCKRLNKKAKSPTDLSNAGWK